MIALNFVSIRQLTTAFAIKPEQLYFCAPRLLTHANRLNVSSTEVVIFTKNVLHLLQFQNDDVFNKTSVPHYWKLAKLTYQHCQLHEGQQDS